MIIPTDLCLRTFLSCAITTSAILVVFYTCLVLIYYPSEQTILHTHVHTAKMPRDVVTKLRFQIFFMNVCGLDRYIDTVQ